MICRLTPSLSIAFALTAGVAAAQAPKPAPTQVQGVDVTAPRTPKVVATYPADGATVPSGETVLKIVFDQPMTPKAWSYGRSSGAAFPDCLARPRLLNDQRTFVLLCSLQAKQSFAIEINAAPDFVSKAERPAPPTKLHFSTDSEATGGLQDAMTKAGLTDADNPIMDWSGASGVSDAPPPPPGAP